MDDTLLAQVRQQLAGPAMQQLAGQLGTSPQQTQSAVDAALPLLLGALSRNTSQPQGAQSLLGALTKDHDGGGILGNLGSLLANPQGGSGAGILGHLFGGKTDAVSQGLGKATGLPRDKVWLLLIVLAPIVLGVLGKMRKSQNMEAPQLQKTISTEKQRVQQHLEQQSPKWGKQRGLESVLDRDHDGQIADDIADMIPGLGSLFSRR